MQQARWADMGEMLMTIAHNWRQPLNAVALDIQDLQDAQRHGELDERYLDRTVAEVMRVLQDLSGTIDLFRDFYTAGDERTRFSAENAVLKSMAILAEHFQTHGIDVNLDFQGDVRLEGSPARFSQVILNLLNNARDAYARRNLGGRIDIEIRRETPGQARITVRDNAGGIPAEILGRIFDPYVSTKKGKAHGAGLGLYAARTAIENSMGGSISVQSIEGGTEFTLLLPAVENNKG